MKTAIGWKSTLVVASMVLLTAACDSPTSDSPRNGSQSTTDPPVTTTALDQDVPTFSMSYITFGPEAFVAIKNTSDFAGTMQRLWLCGEANCLRLPRIGCGPGDSMVVAIGDDLPPLIPAGTVMVEDFRGEFETLDLADGQLGLFTRKQPGRPRHVHDFLEWGSAGHERSALAIAAGVWETGHLRIPADTAGVVARAFPTDSAADWEAQTILDLVEPPPWMTGNPYPIP